MKRRNFLKTLSILPLSVLGVKPVKAAEQIVHPDTKLYQWSYGGPDGLGMVIKSVVECGHPAFSALVADLRLNRGETYVYTAALVFRTIRCISPEHWIRRKYQIKIVPNNQLPSEDCVVYWDVNRWRE